MRVRVGELMVGLVVLGIGLAVGRWAALDQVRRGPLVLSWDGGASGPSTRQWIGLMVSREFRPMVSGVALVAGIAIGLGRLARGPRRIWGEGRWLLASWSISVALQLGNLVLGESARRARLSMVRMSWDSLMGHVSRVIAYGVEARTVLMLIAAWVAARFARWPRDPSPDLLEWAGRILIGLMLLSLSYDFFE